MATQLGYSIELYNSRKRKWEYETTASSYSSALKTAKQRAKMYGKRVKIVKETLIGVYDKTGKKVS